MNILEKIIEQKKMEIAALDASALRRAADSSPTPRDFLASILPSPLHPSPTGRGDGGEGQGVRVSLIAELKRASPSKGLLAPHLDLLQVADLYAQNGASAISVLTDEKFFMGSLSTLQELRARNLKLETSHVTPLLRKDFILHESQLYESRVNGADAILLIAAALTDDFLFHDLHACALTLDS